MLHLKAIRRGLVTAALASVCVVTEASAQLATLSDAQVEAAIAHGLKLKGREAGLDMQDSGASFAAAFAGPAQNVQMGFALVAYTPTAWIRQRASQAAKRYESFSVEDITDGDRAPVLRVMVFANKARYLSGSESVDHVVLRDGRRKVAIQPLDVVPFDDSISNAMGGKSDLAGVQATFSLEELAQLRAQHPSREFFITVIGQGQGEKDFKVKDKHFKHLP